MEKDNGFIGGGSANIKDGCSVKNVVSNTIQFCRTSEKDICKSNTGLISKMFLGKMYDGNGNLVTVKPYDGD